MSKNMVLPKNTVVFPCYMSKNMVLPLKYCSISMVNVQKHGIAQHTVVSPWFMCTNMVLPLKYCSIVMVHAQKHSIVKYQKTHSTSIVLLDKNEISGRVELKTTSTLTLGLIWFLLWTFRVETHLYCVSWAVFFCFVWWAFVSQAPGEHHGGP